MAQKAVTISTECLIPLDEYEERLQDILAALERGLQMAGASYTMPRVRDGISREASDAIPLPKRYAGEYNPLMLPPEGETATWKSGD